MLDLHRLLVLRTVVATGSVREAANRLGFTASAVSQHLGTLQKETGLQLVEREGRGIRPTVAGRALAEESGRALQAMAGVESLVAALRSGRTGSIRIRYFASAGAAWLPPVVAVLTDEFPELRLDLRLAELSGNEESPPDLELVVAQPHLDTARREGYVLHHLVDDPYVVVLPAQHPATHAAEIPLSELASEKWIDHDVNRGPCRLTLLDACARAGYVPEFAVEAHDHATAIAFVAAGVGITVLPKLGVPELPAGLVARRVVEPTPTRSIFVAVKADVARHPAVIRALQLLRRGSAGVDVGCESRAS
ncbi:LysR family transcriptional regulator [Aeromicrobium phragmitis]|uniref:LysR family transcriptional regulator n=1 Tax=Aeromicrobium phragmitis TaxID=2478914 RepID=A0A3L8PS41_9ACTN|nr:LysR family transcriptional regulator [Aeromicrobium phragmitis]RLV57208.1 LysR family transcriptional regulator [Aeromicrobium phragmitis]